MTNHWPYRLTYCLLAGIACVLPACNSDGHFTLLGYTTAPNYDCTIHSVYVPICSNKTMQRGIEFDLTKAIIREVQTKTPFKIVSNAQAADTELVCTIVTLKKSVITPNQLNEVREAQLSYSIEVVWRDLRPGHEGNLLSGKGLGRAAMLDKSGNPPALTDAEKKKDLPVVVTPTTTYQPELGGSMTTAEADLAKSAAVQIVSMMETWGKR